LLATGEGDVNRLQDIDPPEFRLRVGDYRVRFHDSGDAIEILSVKHRREAYRQRFCIYVYLSGGHNNRRLISNHFSLPEIREFLDADHAMPGGTGSLSCNRAIAVP